MKLRLLACGPTIALLAQGELRGAVIDESGGALPRVTVTATHVEAGTSRTTVTADSGSYLMPAMPLGTYKVTAELSGFTTVVREGLQLGVGESVAVNFTLKLAAIQESVTVSGAAPLIDTRQSELTGHVNPDRPETIEVTFCVRGVRALHWDKKVDLRITKNVKIARDVKPDTLRGRTRVQGMLDLFNVFNTANYDPSAYGSQFGTKTYLLPAYSSNLFYQPRMLQVGVRVTY